MNDQKPINENTPIESIEFFENKKTILINKEINLVFNKKYHFNLALAVSNEMPKSKTNRVDGKFMLWAIGNESLDHPKTIRFGSLKAFRNLWVGKFANQHINNKFLKVERIDKTPVGDPSDKEYVIINGDKRRNFLKKVFQHNKEAKPEKAEFWLASPSPKKSENSIASQYRNDLIQVPIFTENNDEYVRFVSETDKFDYELLTNPRGFKVLEDKEDLFYVKRDVNKKLENCIIENQNVLIKGHMGVGKTRLVFDVLRESNELRNSYVFSLYPEALFQIDVLKISDGINKKKKNKLIWFIDDLHDFSCIQNELSRMYDKMTANLGRIIVVTTLRSDMKGISSPLLKDMATIEISPWSYGEGEKLSDHYGYPMDRFAGTPLSLNKDIEKMKELYNSEEFGINCKWVMRYLKLLQEFLPLVDYNLLENTFLYFRKKYKETDVFEESIIRLEKSGFLEIKDNYVLSWEIILEEIVTSKDYQYIEQDLDKLIILLATLNKIGKLNSLGFYFNRNKSFEKSIICYQHIVEISSYRKEYSLKHIAYNNWGSALEELAMLNNNDEELYAESCEKYELAIEEKSDFAEAYSNLGIVLSKLATLHNDEELYNKACNNFELATEYKKDFPEAYYNWGIALSKLADLHNNEDLYNKACNNFELAIKDEKICHDIYCNWGLVLGKLAVLKKNKKELFEDACDKFELAVKCKNDYAEGHYNWGYLLYEYVNLYEDERKFELMIVKILTAYLLSILQSKSELCDYSARLLVRISMESNYKNHIFILTVFSRAQHIISSNKLSNQDIEILEKIRGERKETEIVIEAILDKKIPDYLHVSDEDILLKTAIFLANKVIDTYKSNK